MEMSKTDIVQIPEQIWIDIEPLLSVSDAQFSNRFNQFSAMNTNIDFSFLNQVEENEFPQLLLCC